MPRPSVRRASSAENNTLQSLDTAYSRIPIRLAVRLRTASKSIPLAWKWASLATVTTRDGALAARQPSSAVVSAKCPRWLTPKPSSKPSLVMPLAPATPALLISTCSGSPRARNSAAQLRTEARSARSRGRNAIASFPVAAAISATAARPFSAERQATKTLPPRRARSSAVARPIPVLAPVIRNVRPDRPAEFADMVTLYRTRQYIGQRAPRTPSAGPGPAGSSPAPEGRSRSGARGRAGRRYARPITAGSGQDRHLQEPQ